MRARRKLAVEQRRPARPWRSAPTTAATLAVDENLGARHVATEAVGVPDRHDPDPRRPVGDEPPPVAGALPGSSRLASARYDSQRSAGSSPSARWIGAERRDAVQRDAAANRVEARLGVAKRRRAVRDVTRERLRAGGRLAEALDLELRERRIGLRGRRWLMHARRRRASATGSSGEPQRPIPVSSFRWTRTPSGIATVGGRPSSSRATRASPLSCSEHGPHHEDARVSERGSRWSASGSDRDAERDRTRVERRLRDVDRTVPVPLGLDDRPQLGALGRPQQASRRCAESPRGRG